MINPALHNSFPMEYKVVQYPSINDNSIPVSRGPGRRAAAFCSQFKKFNFLKFYVISKPHKMSKNICSASAQYAVIIAVDKQLPSMANNYTPSQNYPPHAR